MSSVGSTIHNEEKELLFSMDYLPDFFLKKCKLELNEMPKTKNECIQKLRNMLKNEKETKEINFHDDLLVQYLRHSKYNINKALSHLRNFTLLRNKEAEMFQGIPDEYFVTKESSKFLTILPKRSPDGCTIVLSQLGKWDPNELGIEDLKRIIFMVFSQALRDPMTQINGFKIIHDFAGTRFEHMKYCTPQNLYLFYYVSIYCIPGRYKEIHLLNETAVLKLLWTMIKPFLSDKIRNRVFFHSDTRQLLKYFPKSVLPVQYGGDLLEIYTTNFTQTANKEQKKNTIEGQPNFY